MGRRTVRLEHCHVLLYSRERYHPAPAVCVDYLPHTHGTVLTFFPYIYLSRWFFHESRHGAFVLQYPVRDCVCLFCVWAKSLFFISSRSRPFLFLGLYLGARSHLSITTVLSSNVSPIQSPTAEEEEGEAKKTHINGHHPRAKKGRASWRGV